MCKSQTCGSGVENLQRLISIRWISDGLELKRKKGTKKEEEKMMWRKVVKKKTCFPCLPLWQYKRFVAIYW